MDIDLENEERKALEEWLESAPDFLLIGGVNVTPEQRQVYIVGSRVPLLIDEGYSVTISGTIR